MERAPAGKPDPDVASSEAWLAVDEGSAVVLDLPRIEGRYYTVQIVNPWGETLVNINDRTFPQHPYGGFAFCLQGSRVSLPPGVERIDLPNRKARLSARIELGATPDEAAALLRQLSLRNPRSTPIPPR